MSSFALPFWLFHGFTAHPSPHQHPDYGARAEMNHSICLAHSLLCIHWPLWFSPELPAQIMTPDGIEYSVVESQRAILDCEVFGVPRPTVKWWACCYFLFHLSWAAVIAFARHLLYTKGRGAWMSLGDVALLSSVNGKGFRICSALMLREWAIIASTCALIA